MNYFHRIKPVLNKLTELNVYDSLYVVRAYIQASVDRNTRKEFIQGVNHSEANSVEVWFADFLIANIIKYCDDLPCKKSLRDVNTRHQICNPIEEQHEEVSHKQMDQEVFVWLNSYIFNQTKITLRDNELRSLYRYYCLYKSAKIRAYAEQRMNQSLEMYFKVAFFVYAIFANKDRFHVSESYFMPKEVEREDGFLKSLEYVLGEISKTLPELKAMCKEFCNYEEENLFGYYNNAPHVKYPLIKDQDGYYCTIPRYLPLALLDGLYYRLDIPNCGDQSIGKEFSENMENYLGMIFDHFLDGTKVECLQEIVYDVGKRKSQRTSDWILWDERDICFLDCKTKRISVKGKQAVTVDDDTIERVVNDKPFSRKRKKKEIDEAIPEGITKDLINLGIGIGKIFVSYDDYKVGNIKALPYMEGLVFHAVLVTLEESFSNTPGYKERILKVAQSYRDAKSDRTEAIDGKVVEILSVRNVEEGTCVIGKEGIGFYLKNHMNTDVIKEKWVKDPYLLDKCNEDLINPFLDDLKPYYGDNARADLRSTDKRN